MTDSTQNTADKSKDGSAEPPAPKAATQAKVAAKQGAAGGAQKTAPRQQAKPKPKVKSYKAKCWVRKDGTRYAPGKPLSLTETEAEELKAAGAI